jgi:hypothetical protein
MRPRVALFLPTPAPAIRPSKKPAAARLRPRTASVADMGGFGSGRSGGRPTVESALRLDIDSMMCWGAIQPGFHRVGKMQLHQFYGDDIDVKFESLAGDPWHSWLRLRYSIADYWSGEELKIDDKVYLAPTRPHFGGLRWWFVYLQRKSPARAAGLEVLGLVSKAECALHLAEIRAPALDPHKKC